MARPTIPEVCHPGEGGCNRARPYDDQNVTGGRTEAGNVAKSASKKSKIQLLSEFDGLDWQTQFLRLLNLTTLLRKSIIGKDYSVPDEMNNAIHLTSYGAEIAQTLKVRHDVPYKEAKLMCFLVLAYQEPLIDMEKTNYPVLIEEIGKQIQTGDILHPFIFGRVLYDRAADLFDDERKYLNVKDTFKLLSGTPRGVWQVGDLTTGPYGVMRVETRRHLPPQTVLPLQHCADLACDSLHAVSLTTDYEAPINLHRHKLTRLLEQNGKEPSDWNGYIDSISQKIHPTERNDDLDKSCLVYLLGDGLSDGELRKLFERLLDNSGNKIRGYLDERSIRGAAHDVAARLTRAEMLQLALRLDDSHIARTLDEAVLANAIEVPESEVRTAQVNAGLVGPWGLHAALGARGISFRGDTPSLPLLRLHRLITSLFNPDRVEDMDTLDWHLRHIDASTPGAKLAEYLRTESPESVLRNLALAREGNAKSACDSLGLPAPSTMDDETIISSLLWKLGFHSRIHDRPHARFFERQNEIMKLAREAQLSSTVDEEPIRRVAAVYFEDLEALLDDSLAYATWGLTNDHFASEKPFVFRPDLDTLPSLQQLSGRAAADTAAAINFGPQNTLFPLIRGFAILAELLDELRSDSDSHKRDPKSFPDYLQYTNLQTFPFRHTKPFLDVSGNAQVSIIEQLREVSQRLLRFDVPEVRNSLAHFRRTTVDINKVISCLEAVAAAVSQISSLGFLRTPFNRATTRTDEWYRRTVTLTSQDGQQVSFTRPSPYDALPLPHLSTEQYLMHSAIFAEPNEVLRFRLGTNSEYEKIWTKYPRRRASKDNSIATQSENDSIAVDESGRLGTRAG
ncbi:MAG: hypothetical protein ACQEXM_23975 [Actinomycetota bacterium]